jgi:hypothetical protein
MLQLQPCEMHLKGSGVRHRTLHLSRLIEPHRNRNTSQHGVPIVRGLIMLCKMKSFSTVVATRALRGLRSSRTDPSLLFVRVIPLLASILFVYSDARVKRNHARVTSSHAVNTSHLHSAPSAISQHCSFESSTKTCPHPSSSRRGLLPRLRLVSSLMLITSHGDRGLSSHLQVICKRTIQIKYLFHQRAKTLGKKKPTRGPRPTPTGLRRQHPGRGGTEEGNAQQHETQAAAQ